MALSSVSNANCNLATLSPGQTVTLDGASCVYVSDSANSTVLQCKSAAFEVDTFGLFSFQDINTGDCISYDYATDAMDGFFTSAFVFTVARWLCGMIVIVWLLLATCCPIRPAHKKSLVVLATLAFVFQGLTFLFYGNYICQTNGCYLGEGGYFAIASACVFFITIPALLPIKAKEASWMLQQQQQEQWIEQKATTDSADEGMKPAVTGVVMEAQP